MKRGIMILILLATLILPIATAAQTEPNTKYQIPNTDSAEKPNLNPWNETIIISDTWQTLIGTFFGLNLKNVSTEISVRETLVFFSVFIMFLIIILDILKITPFFKTKLGIVSGEFLAAIIITTLISISGALINLKNLFLKAVEYLIKKLNLDFINTALKETTASSIITGILVIVSFAFIVLFFNMINPLLKKYSQISKAEANGRLLNNTLEKTEET